MAMKTVTCVDLEGKQYKIAASELRWRPSAYAVVMRDKHLLLARDVSGAYTLPGGGLELGELPEAAVIREVREETGIEVTNPRPLHFASNFFTLSASDRGKCVQSILLYYQCDFGGGELSLKYLPPEDRAYHQLPEWVPLERLAQIEVVDSCDWRPLVKGLKQ